MCKDCKCNNDEYDLEVKFAKVNPDAIIPSKRDEDGGYDIYSCFEENELRINAGEKAMIGTGIATAFTENYVAILRERGSTGSRLMAVRAGIIDSGFRNEWMVIINNTGNTIIIITKDEEQSRKEITDKVIAESGVTEDQLKVWAEENSIKNWINDHFVFYPYQKAIAQFLFVPVPKVNITEIPYEELLKIESERGLGLLGSSDK
jgi:dUTP pyrophosphatase